MPVYRLGEAPVFPDPREAEPDGLLAVGGDLAPERLLAAYAAGIFPWYDEGPPLWFSPDPRAALAPRDLHLSRRLRRTMRSGAFRFRLDADFAGVIRACAGIRRAGQNGTWIHRDMIAAYERLHALGFAHSAEAYDAADQLVGGIYGISLGGAFFGESMFHRARDASKAALVALCAQLDAWGFSLFDCQLPTAHLTRLGAESWPRERFLATLAEALQAPTRRGRWELEPEALARRLDQP